MSDDTVYGIIPAGQSNAMGFGKRIQLAPVPTWAQTAANGWDGAPTRSSDSGIEYPHPTLANSPSRYNENNTGLMAGVYNAHGSYDGQSPKYSSGGAIGEVGSYGPECSFAQLYRADRPGVELAIVKCVLGGSSIDDWLPEANKMWPIFVAMIQQMAARVAAEGKTLRWDVMPWHQGENGCSSVYPFLNDPQSYSTKLRRFLSLVREVTSPDLRVLIDRVGNHMMAPAIIGTRSSGIDTPENRLAATQHRREQQMLVGGDPGNIWVDTDNLPVLQSGSDPSQWFHHTGAGYLALGERNYAAYQQLAGIAPPPPPPPPPAPMTIIVRQEGIVHPDLTATVTLNGEPIGGSGDTLVVDLEAA